MGTENSSGGGEGNWQFVWADLQAFASRRNKGIVLRRLVNHAWVYQHLTPIESRLLRIFFRRGLHQTVLQKDLERIFSQKQASSQQSSTRTKGYGKPSKRLARHIHALRKKLSVLGLRLYRVRSVGYLLKEADEGDR